MITIYRLTALALAASDLIIAQGQQANQQPGEVVEHEFTVTETHIAPTTVVVEVIRSGDALYTTTLLDPSPKQSPAPVNPPLSSSTSSLQSSTSTMTPAASPPPSTTSSSSSSSSSSSVVKPPPSSTSSIPALSPSPPLPSPPPPSTGFAKHLDTSAAVCGPNCAMSVRFTGLNVPFAIDPHSGHAQIMQGMTAGTCLCFEAGSPRAVIGTYDTGAMATLFEGSAAGPNNSFLDVSFVQGYTYPMVCTGKGGSISGFSTDLYAIPGSKCPRSPSGKQGQQMGEICSNPQGPDGDRNPKEPPANGNNPTANPWCQACSAPDPFFAPAAGKAYTYPYDDDATVKDDEITCCIGPQCDNNPGTGTSSARGNCNADTVAKRKDPCIPCPGTGSCQLSPKRDLEHVFEEVEKKKRSHLKRHRHAFEHGHKY